jgi:hypothetical protein
VLGDSHGSAQVAFPRGIVILLVVVIVVVVLVVTRRDKGI